MSEKRKAESGNGQPQKIAKTASSTVSKKLETKVVAAAPAMRYTQQQETLYEQPVVMAPIPTDRPAPAPMAPSYQDVLKAADKNSQPKYVFPQNAPKPHQVQQQQLQQLINGTLPPAAAANLLTPSGVQRHFRKAANEVWEDQTLTQWREDDYRIFVGDLGNEVTDDMLMKAFNKYPSFLKARVIRDKKSTKSKGFGFVSFGDANDFTAALREMNGKYIGNRPCKLKKSTWAEREAPEISEKIRQQQIQQLQQQQLQLQKKKKK